MSDLWVRPTGYKPPFPPADTEVIRGELNGVKRLLEFGPGDSTQAFLDLGVEHITTCEHIDKWFEVAKERFANDPRVRVLKFTDEFPVTVEGLGDETFDLAFVDTPQGYAAMRKKHPGYEDCSRLNTCLFAVERAPVVLLHDAYRCLERASLGRLSAMGHKYRFLNSEYGMARIEGRPKNESVSMGNSRSQKRKLKRPTSLNAAL